MEKSVLRASKVAKKHGESKARKMGHDVEDEQIEGVNVVKKDFTKNKCVELKEKYKSSK